MKRNKINKLAIQNFKAFGEMVDIPIRPITLIFGENSSGKSSILHSLLFLSQMQHQPQDQLADITYTKAGGNSVDLGGLPQLKYGQSNKNELSFQVNVSNHFDFIGITNVDIAFKYIFSKSNQLSEIELIVNEQIICKFIKQSIAVKRNTFELEVNLDNALWLIKHSEHAKRLISYRIRDINPEKITELDFDKHFSAYMNQNTLLKALVSTLTLIENRLNSSNNENNIINFIGSNRIYNFTLDRCYIHSSDKKDFKNHILYDQKKRIDNEVDAINTTLSSNRIALQMSNPTYLFTNVLYQVFSTEFNAMTNALSSFSYLGPIRTIPTRNFDTLDSISRDPSTGSLAWEELTTNEKARNQVNKWLTQFGTNKQIKTEQLVDSAQLRKILAESTKLEEVMPAINTLSNRSMLRFYDVNKNIYLSHRDLGVGISQVLPVIVNSVANTQTTVLIEQPELHLHPRLQGDLADLFIDTAIKGVQHNTFLLETHSEALILRLLRRVREGVIKPDDIAILYVSAGDNGSTVKHIRIDEDGDFLDRWPNGFFEETYRDRMGF